MVLRRFGDQRRGGVTQRQDEFVGVSRLNIELSQGMGWEVREIARHKNAGLAVNCGCQNMPVPLVR